MSATSAENVSVPRRGWFRRRGWLVVVGRADSTEVSLALHGTNGYIQWHEFTSTFTNECQEVASPLVAAGNLGTGLASSRASAGVAFIQA